MIDLVSCPCKVAGLQPDERRQILAGYRCLRTTQMALHERLKGMVGLESLLEAAQDLGMTSEEDLVSRRNDELAALWDHAFYDILVDGKNAVTRFFAGLAPDQSDDSDETALLRAMINARHSIYEVQAVEVDFGLWLEDLLQSRSRFVVDLALSRSVSPGAAIAGRFLEVRGLCMSTGALLFLYSMNLRDTVLSEAKSVLATTGATSPADLLPEARAHLAGAIIKKALVGGAGRAMAYRDVALKGD